MILRSAAGRETLLTANEPETGMNAEQLRTLQAPLKQRYRDTPDAARVAARAQIKDDTERILRPLWQTLRP